MKHTSEDENKTLLTVQLVRYFPFLRKHLHTNNINVACCVIECIQMHWLKMTFHLWLLLFMTPLAVAKCGSNNYYDGLSEDCQPCSVRCNSPPAICVTYCKSTACKYAINKYISMPLLMMSQSCRRIYESYMNLLPLRRWNRLKVLGDSNPSDFQHRFLAIYMTGVKRGNNHLMIFTTLYLSQPLLMKEKRTEIFVSSS